MLSRRASPLSFAGPPRQAILPLRLEELPPIDVVLLSHDHYDHLDKASIRAIQRHHTPLFLAPLGVGATLRRWGATRVAELDWWQYADVEGVRYHCTPAMHFSGRGPTNRDGTLWCGWYVETDVRARRTSDEDGRPGKADVQAARNGTRADVRPNGALAQGGRRAETDVQAGAGGRRGWGRRPSRDGPRITCGAGCPDRGGVLRGRLGLCGPLRRDPRAAGGAGGGAPPHRRLPAPVVHEARPHGPRRSRAGVHGRRGPPTSSRSTGAPSTSPTSRSRSPPRASRSALGKPASRTGSTSSTSAPPSRPNGRPLRCPRAARRDGRPPYP